MFRPTGRSVIDFRPIFLVIGVLLVVLALAMVLPAIADMAADNPDWRVFLMAAAVTLFFGAALAFANRGRGFTNLTTRQAFLLTTLSWTIVPVFAALPLVFSELRLSYTDAFFEAMSGLTTTGSTVIVGLDTAPPGVLLWRALLQWLGGIGIIAMAVAILPMLRVGGMQLFRAESSDRGEKILPRARQIGAAIGGVYLMLTLIWLGALWAAGMSGFDALAHAMTTIATGGFSTHDGSIGRFDSAAIEWIVIGGMLVGGIPFVLYAQFISGRGGALLRDSQVRWFLAMAVIAALTMTAWLWATSEADAGEALRLAAFNAISIMTGTGYTSADYGQWGTLAVAMFFFLSFVGGCTGSTTGGIKIFRFQVLYGAMRVQMGRLVQPHGVFKHRFNGKPVPDSVAGSVMGMFFLFMLSFALIAAGLAYLGLDFMTSVSGAATAIANVGPGLGDVIGPSGTFTSLPDSAKWLLAFAMLLGRLELLTVLVLFTRRFWRG